MYVKDVVNDFYNKIIGKKVLVLANCDVDSVCTCKILQWLFQCDSIVYTLIPVQGVQDMLTAFGEHSSEVKYVILINCGGTLDILEVLQPESDVIFYIIDSHRPTDVCNIYNNDQIYIVPKPEDSEAIPDFDDIFGNEDVDNEEDGSDVEGDSDDERGESRGAKRQRLNESAILRRRELRLWEDKRNRLMFDYTQFSYYGRSSAILLYELAWKLSKDNIDVLWWGIVGVSSQLVLGQAATEQYQQEIEHVTLHIGRLCPSVADDDTASVHSASTVHASAYTTATRITSDKDLALALYRHWTVEQSLRHSLFTAVRLKLWTIRGEKRLQQLLAEMGLPLAESRQMFTAMDLSLRRQFHAMMDKMADTHQLDNVVFSSFTLHHGCRHRYQAIDFVYAMIALFNPTGKEMKYNDCFRDALACLSRQQRSVLEQGIERAKRLLTVIYRQIHNSLDMKQIVSAGPFLYLVIQEGSLDARYYSEPTCLLMLARVALRAHVAGSRKKVSGLPLVASAPVHLSEGVCLIVGVPPVAEAVPRNFFGKAFEQAAEKTNSRIEVDYFDSAVIRLKTEDRPKFFDALTALLS